MGVLEYTYLVFGGILEPLLVLWQYRVLIREDVRQLFGVGGEGY